MRFFSFLLGFCLLFPGASLAAQLIVLDCHGATRAICPLDRKETKTVRLEVQNIVKGEVALTERKSSQAYRASVADGQVEFEDVGTGIWRACTDSPEKIEIARVQIIE